MLAIYATQTKSWFYSYYFLSILPTSLSCPLSADFSHLWAHQNTTTLSAAVIKNDTKNRLKTCNSLSLTSIDESCQQRDSQEKSAQLFKHIWMLNMLKDTHLSLYQPGISEPLVILDFANLTKLEIFGLLPSDIENIQTLDLFPGRLHIMCGYSENRFLSSEGFSYLASQYTIF